MNKLKNFFVEQIEENDPMTYGRVVVDYGTMYKVKIEEQIVSATVTGKYRNTSEEMPVIGDYVGVTIYNDGQECLIHRLLNRQSEFARKVAGNRTDKQVQGANFDTVFIVMALNNDFNVRKLERFVLAAWDTGARPVVILNKADLCEAIEERLLEVNQVTPGVEVHVVSALEGDGIDPIRAYLTQGSTIALFGASGVGKSTLINCLAGHEVMKVNTVRRGDDRGQHTTTHREMIFFEGGVSLIDTPGMRELGIWDDGEGVDQTFSEIVEIANRCKFVDCSHTNEPGCAIREAIENGLLEEQRYESYLKLRKEAAFIERKSNQKLRMEEKKKWRDISMYSRNKNKVKY